VKPPVLVTGGAGYLGRHLASALAAAGHPVTVLDSLVARSSDMRAPELRAPGIRRIVGSTRDASLVRDLVHAHPRVLHLASVVGVEETMADTRSTMRNLEGTLHLAEALTSRHAVVFASSADVYGVHSHHYARPMAEDDHEIFEPARVNRWVYGRIKGLEENLLHNCDASSVCVRVFNCYGPGMDFPGGRRIIPRFLENVMDRTPFRISGDGSQRRSYCYVDDMVRGLPRNVHGAADRARRERGRRGGGVAGRAAPRGTAQHPLQPRLRRQLEPHPRHLPCAARAGVRAFRPVRHRAAPDAGGHGAALPDPAGRMRALLPDFLPAEPPPA
jgi:nucleoside-diphosphate-sugar epimerase